MAQKKQTIVIKKIIVSGGGHHGGSWKVALADFMTAMMAFFLVMWLLGQNEETKKAVSDYFSTPSMIEYNFQNFGAELTLEKLFLDLVNEPLKAFQSFLEPADKTPNILDMGSQKVVAAFMADKMTDVAKNVNISQDGFDFDIPDTYLFERGTSLPNKKFIEVLNRLIQVTSGLQESEIRLTSAMFNQAVIDRKELTAKRVAQERVDLVANKIKASFEHSSNSVFGGVIVRDKKGEVAQERLIGFIRVNIRQKANTDKPRRKLEKIFGEGDNSKNVYDRFADQVVNRQPSASKNVESDGELHFVNPAEAEVQRATIEADPSSTEIVPDQKSSDRH